MSMEDRIRILEKRLYYTQLMVTGLTFLVLIGIVL